MDDAELVAETLPWSQKRNAAGVAAFAAFNHLQQEVHIRRTRDPNLTTPFTDNETLQNFYKLELIRGVTPRGYSEGLLQGSTSKRKYIWWPSNTVCVSLPCARIKACSVCWRTYGGHPIQFL